MSDTTNVCRLCLKIVPPDKFSAFDTTVTQKLKLLIPNLTLTPVSNLVICNDCHASLEESSKLKRTCSSSNKLIKFLKNYLGVSHAVELKELIKGNNKKQEENWPKYGHICRICLKSNEGQYTSIADAKNEEFGAVFSSCLSILEENLTTNPLICKICINILHKMCAFVKQCHDLEGRVNSYSKSVPGEVDLLKLTNCLNDDLTCQNGEQSKEKEVSNEEERPSTKQDAKNPQEDEECLKDELTLLIEEQDKNISELVAEDYDIPHFRFGMDLVHHPYKRRKDFKEWLEKVEKIKLEQHLSDLMVIQRIVEMMKNFSWRVQEYFASATQSWPEFKEKLQNAFPESDDYHANVQNLVAIKRKRNQSFVKYYEKKMPILKQLNFTEEQMVSFLLGGINSPCVGVEARIAQHKTSEAVLAYFKACDKKETPSVVKKMRSKRISRRKCACCDQKGHSSINCPLVEQKVQESQQIADKADQNNKEIVVPENGSISGGSSEGKPQDASKSASKKNVSQEKAEVLKNPTLNQSSPKCACCDKFGHCSMTCPMLRNNLARSEKANSTNDEVIVIDDALPLQEDAPPKRSVPSGIDTVIIDGESSPSKPRTSVKIAVNNETVIEKTRESLADDSACEVNARKKCSCCDKLGHTSLDCPFIVATKADMFFNCNKLGHKVHPKVKNEEEPDASHRKCWRCKEKGHFSANCPRPNSNVNASTASSSGQIENKPQTQTAAQTANKNAETPTKKGWNCNQSGHSSKKCPIAKSKSVNSSWQMEKEPRKQTAVQTPNKNKEAPTKNCRNCNQLGHSFSNCPLANSNNVAASFVSNKWQNENKPQQQTATQIPNLNTELAPKRCSGCSQPGHLVRNCPLSNSSGVKSRWQMGNEPPKQTPAQTSNRTAEVLPPNCWFCKQSGHMFQNCPMFKNNVAQAQEKTLWQNIEKCTTCNIYGHSSLNCPVVEAVKIATMPWMAQQPEQRKVEAPPPQNKPNRKRRCLCCNNIDHTSLDCPLLKNNRSNLVQQPVNTLKPQEPEKCLCCSQTGHPTWDCAYYSFFQAAGSKINHSTANEEINVAKRAKFTEKCYFCDEVGHSSSDCFRNRFETAARPSSSQLPASQISYTDPSVVVMSSQSLAVCEFCKKIGHSVSECFEASFDRKTYEAHHGHSSSRHCLSCGKLGHLPSDCPKKRRSSRSVKTSKSKKHRRD